VQTATTSATASTRRGGPTRSPSSCARAFAKGWSFDPDARRFLDPAAGGPDAEAPLTVYEHCVDYLRRKWRVWEPATRPHAQRDLARACIYLVAKDAPALSGDERITADAFLREAALTVPEPRQLTAEQERWAAWFERWSLPLPEVTDRHLQGFLDEVGSRTLSGKERALAASGLARTRAVVRAAFTYAHKRRLIEWDPWAPVEAPSLRDHDRVDPDLVMTPSLVRALARACAAAHPRYELYASSRASAACGQGKRWSCGVATSGYRNGVPPA
jgi:hypothetical protein